MTEAEVSQRPYLSRKAQSSVVGAHDGGGGSEKVAAALASVPEHRRVIRLAIQQDRPAIFDVRQCFAAHALGQDIGDERLQQRLGRRAIPIQLLQRFAPPRQAHEADHRLAGGGDDLTEAFVKLEQGGQRRPHRARRIGDRERAFGIGKLRRGRDGVAQR